MEVENQNLPADKQDIDRIVDGEFYLQYLSDCVEMGVLSEEEAKEIREKKDWKKIENLIDKADYVASLEDDE